MDCGNYPAIDEPDFINITIQMALFEIDAKKLDSRQIAIINRVRRVLSGIFEGQMIIIAFSLLIIIAIFIREYVISHYRDIQDAQNLDVGLNRQDEAMRQEEIEQLNNRLLNAKHFPVAANPDRSASRDERRTYKTNSNYTNSAATTAKRVTKSVSAQFNSPSDLSRQFLSRSSEPVNHGYSLRSNAKNKYDSSTEEDHDQKMQSSTQKFRGGSPPPIIVHGRHSPDYRLRRRSTPHNSDSDDDGLWDDADLPQIADNQQPPVNLDNDFRNVEPDLFRVFANQFNEHPPQVQEDILDVNINIGIENGGFVAEINANGDVFAFLDLFGVIGPLGRFFKNLCYAHAIVIACIFFVVYIPDQIGRFAYTLIDTVYLPILHYILQKSTSALQLLTDPIVEPLVDVTLMFAKSVLNMSGLISDDSAPLAFINVIAVPNEITGPLAQTAGSFAGHIYWALGGWTTILLAAIIWATSFGGSPIAQSVKGFVMAGILSAYYSFKFTFFLLFELGLFPAYCGLIVNLITVPIFGPQLTIASRLLFITNHPIVSMFLHCNDIFNV